MWYAERKIPMDLSALDNDTEYNSWVDQRIQEILEVNPGMDPLEARIRELISRSRGDSGLSRHRVDYLVAHIMRIIRSM